MIKTSQNIEYLQYQIQRNAFEIDTLRVKLDKARHRFEDEHQFLLEQLNRGPIRFDLTRKMELNIRLDAEAAKIRDGYKERLEGALAVVQAREQFRTKSLEAQLQLEQVDQHTIDTVKALRAENQKLTQEVNIWVIKNDELDRRIRDAQEEIRRLKEEKVLRAKNNFWQIKAETQTLLQQSYSSTRPVKAIPLVAKKTQFERRRPYLDPIDCYNNDYVNLHRGCREELEEIRSEFLETMKEAQNLQETKDNVEETLRRVLIKNNFIPKQEGFLDIAELTDKEIDRFMTLLLEHGCIDKIIYLCILEDLAYNIQRRGQVNQRVGLTSKSKGLRKTYDVVYDL